MQLSTRVNQLCQGDTAIAPVYPTFTLRYHFANYVETFARSQAGFESTVLRE